MPASVTTLEALLETPSAEQFKASMLSALEGLEFPVTSWEVDGVVYQMLACLSQQMATLALVQRGIASGGFLDLAADLKNADGTDSRPWLDLLSTYLYQCPRIEAVVASGDYTLTNSNGFPIVLAPGDVRCVNEDGYTYTNTTGGTVPASGTLSVTIAADQPGITGTAAAGSIVVQDGPAGLTGANPAVLVGLPEETNALLAARCRAKLASLSPNGSADAYRYFSPLATDTATGINLGVTRVGVNTRHFDPGEPALEPYPGEVWLIAATASGPLGGTLSPPATSGPCYQLWKYLMNWCVPDAIKLVVKPATIQAITVTATVYVTEPTITEDQVWEAIATYFGQVPIGGVVLSNQGVVPYSAIIDSIHNVSPIVKSVVLASPAANVVLDPTDVPVLNQFASSLTFVVMP